MRAPIGKEQRQILKKVLRYIRRYWGYLGCSVVLAAFTALCMLYVPVLIGQAVDWIIGAGNVGFTELFFGSSENGGRDFFDCGGAVGDECLQQQADLPCGP